jgi:hypothetical protein
VRAEAIDERALRSSRLAVAGVFSLPVFRHSSHPPQLKAYLLYTVSEQAAKFQFCRCMISN